MKTRNSFGWHRNLAVAPAVVALAVVALVACGLADVARAQEGKRQTIAMRDKVYTKLSRAEEAAEAGDWSTAFDLLGDVEKMKDLDANEKAQLYTAYGYTYFAQEKYQDSIDAYEKVLDQPELSEALQTSTLYTLAQLWFHVGNYANAATRLEAWINTATNPGPEPYVLLAQAYYQQEKFRDAVAPMERAIVIAGQRGQKTKENWYVLLRALYHELGDYPKLLGVLESLLTEYPRKEYWLHLAAAYGEMEDDRRQLAAYEAAYRQGFLVSGQELLLISQLLLQADVPYKAGVILEQALADGAVEGTAQNWRLLSQAWILAHEDARAIEALSKAASLSDDGELDARLAQCHANLDDWENAVTASRVALDKGVRAAHQLQIMMGMALFELERYDEARDAFRAAQATPEGRETASRWLAYVDREQQRLLELKRTLE